MKFVANSRPGIAGAVLLSVIGAVIAFSGIGASTHADQACPGGKVKYYRNPMGTPDTSPVPKKDSMNMDYIAVCEEETGALPGTVRISLDKVQLLGVRIAEVQARALSRSIRAFATVQYDERRQYVVAPKFSGWIEKLAVNATGDVVTRGQILFEVYSPELNVFAAGMEARRPQRCGLGQAAQP
jgi:Cu(I)/Ag(I) efflux system membrane fusion protein